MAGRAAIAALAGAGGAAAYVNKDSYPSQVLRRIWESPNWQQAPLPQHNGELDRISRMVEHLSRDVHRQQSVTILRTDKTGHNVILLVAGAAGVTYVYLRFWCGLKIGDLMYVTKASLGKHLSQTAEGFHKTIESFKSSINKQMSGINSKQDDAAAAQDDMKHQLSHLGSDVEALGGNVGEVNDAVQDLRGKWEQMRITQEDALLGIHALCGSVQDLMCRTNIKGPAANRLDAYIRRPRSSLLVSPEASSGFAAALRDDSAASNGRLLGDGSEGQPRLGMFKRAMSLGTSGSQNRQPHNNRLARNNSSQPSNISERSFDTEDDD